MRFLVVEDEMTIAMLIEDMLVDLGHDVVAVAMRLPAALEAARDEEFDMALLDVNLAGLTSFPVADILCERNIPFAFATGFGSAGVEADYGARPILHKPFRRSDLTEVIVRASEA